VTPGSGPRQPTCKEVSALDPTIPQTTAASPQDPGTVRVVLTGTAPALIKVVLFLGQVLAGDSPAEVLRTLGLSAIRIKSESGRNHRVTLTLQLEEAGR
jgi:hypothetical protein